MDAIRGWLARWEFCMTACAIPEFALQYTKVIRFTRRGQNLSTCTYSNLSMVYAEVMLGKRVNWSTMMAHSCSDIIAKTIDIPTNVNRNGGLMHYAIINGLLRQGWVLSSRSPMKPISAYGYASRTSRSSKNNRFPYIFHWLVLSCEFHSIFFAKLVRQI
jgi:hypothetical protein